MSRRRSCWNNHCAGTQIASTRVLSRNLLEKINARLHLPCAERTAAPQQFGLSLEPAEDYLPFIKTGDSPLPLKGLTPCFCLIWLASFGNGAATTKAFAS
jgi:hypothetical protein